LEGVKALGRLNFWLPTGKFKRPNNFKTILLDYWFNFGEPGLAGAETKLGQGGLINSGLAFKVNFGFYIPGKALNSSRRG